MKIKIIQTTTNTIETAESISKILVKNNISPCVQIISNVRSIYQWNGKIEYSNEIILNIKTIPANIEQTKDIILKHHNYDMPEFIVMDANILDDVYKAWFMDHCLKT